MKVNHDEGASAGRYVGLDDIIPETQQPYNA